MKRGVSLAVWVLSFSAGAAWGACPRDLLARHDRVVLTPADIYNGLYVVVLDPAANDRSETGHAFELSTVELFNPGTATLYPSGDGTLTFTGVPEQVGTKQASYRLVSDDGAWQDGTIEFSETTGGICAPTARADSFTIGEGFGEYLDVLANDDHPLCAAVHLVPYPNAIAATAEGGTVQVVSVNAAEQIYYYPPQYNYRGTDTFTYTSEVNGLTASALVTVNVVATATSPAFGCFFPLGQPNRVVLDLDRYCSRPSTRECEQPSGNTTVVQRAQINSYCWNFGHEGNPNLCNANWEGGWVLHGPHGVCRC